VAGEEVKAPARIARLGAHSACPTRLVQVTVAGGQMRDIALSINGGTCARSPCERVSGP
jgi:hypothetical protein